MTEEATMTAAEKVTVEYAIPEFNWGKASKKLESLTRRAKKLGVNGLTYEVKGEEVREVKTGKYTLEGRPITVEILYVLVDVTGDAPVIAGYTFAATVEHTEEGNVLRKVPGCEIDAPLSYRTASRKCEHCNKIRSRKDTYLVLNNETGEWKQVGKSCLRDFLGENVDSFLSRLSWWDTVGSFGDLDPDEFGWGEGRCEPLYSRLDFLKACAILVRTEGWLSRTRARETEGFTSTSATADSALWLLSPSFTDGEKKAKNKIWDKQIPADWETAKKTVAWVESEWASKDVGARSEYEHNVVVSLAANHGRVTRKSAGLVGSAISCYLRAMDRLEIAKAEAENSLNEHFGEIGGGDKIGEYKRGAKKGQPKFQKGYDLTLRIVSIFEKVDEWGERPTVFIHKLKDAEGRTFTWFGSRRIYDENHTVAERGDSFSATWNVKAHNEFKGRLETIINRPRNEKIVTVSD
jgi:hypothetical protein